MLWYVWTALLAAMPYNAFEIMGPVVPGQIGMAPLSCAIMVLVSWQVIAPSLACEFRRAVERVRGAIVRLGQGATVVLILVETCVIIRGRRFLLEEWLVSFNTVLIYIEAICACLAVVGWGLSSWCFTEAPRPPFSTRLLAAFLAGGSIPAAFMLLADLGGFWPSALGALLCMLFGIGVYIVLQRSCPGDSCSFDEVILLLAGTLSYQVSKALLNEIRVDMLFALEPPFSPLPVVPDKMVYAIYLAIILGISGMLWIVMRRRERAGCAEASCLESQTDVGKSAKVDVAPLLARSIKPLTEREVSVMEGTVCGESAEKIAGELGLAKSTVATYRRRCCEKLGVRGVKELRELADEACGVGLEEDLKLGTSYDEELVGSDDGGGDTGGLVRPLLIVLLLLIGPSETMVPAELQMGDMRFTRLPFAIFWLVCLIGIMSCAVRELGNRSPIGMRAPHETVASILLTYAVSISAYCIWCGNGGAGILLFTMLSVCGLTFGGEDWLSKDGLAPRACGLVESVLKGIDKLLIADSRPALLAFASLCLSMDLLIPSYPYLLMRFLDPLFVLVAACLLLIEVYDRNTSRVVLSARKEDRGLSYLMGRGLGELQARVMLDLACGYRSREVCERRNVAPSTVRSYRYRCFAQLGVNSMSELRKLLFTEAGVTGFSKVQRPE